MEEWSSGKHQKENKLWYGNKKKKIKKKWTGTRSKEKLPTGSLCPH